jgi:hypothetical protein
MRTIVCICCIAVLHSHAAVGSTQPGIRGEVDAVAAAERLLQHVGGREIWRRRTMIVRERAFLRSGEVAELTITRDLERGARAIENVTATRRVVEWLSPESGWESRNGASTALSRSALAMELQGLRQEPYAIYHRLAMQDSALRVELRDQIYKLFVYDRNEQVICWFQLDEQRALFGWGNIYDGRINQHYYGPLVRMGDVNLPKWGVASNGSFRFEYVNASLNDEPISEPQRK